MQLILHPSHRRAMHRNHIRRHSPAPVTEKVLIPDIKSLFPNWTSSTNQISHWREIYMLSFWIVSQFLLPRLPMRFPLLLVVGGHSTSLSGKACSWYQSPSDSTLTWSSTTGLSSLDGSETQNTQESIAYTNCSMQKHSERHANLACKNTQIRESRGLVGNWKTQNIMQIKKILLEIAISW